MRITDIIAAKRDSRALTEKEIEFFVNGVTDNTIPDYQISAMLMAICIRGMDSEETAHLTKYMSESGEMLDLSCLGDKTVDKHSTGGVGDKTTLICAPIAAALGCSVAKMSGRGLGYTGGTVDKLESIAGYRTKLERSEFFKISKEIGICLMGHSGSFALADGKLYKLRDVTATVESIPLIASSIMSKKLAAGAENILLDVKVGSGAFMKTKEDARLLAKTMVEIGNRCGRKTRALLTDMSIPLGKAIGNSLEVIEAVEVLKGRGNSRLREICIILAANMYSLCFDEDMDTSIIKAENALNSGAAYKKLCELVELQGGNVKLLSGEESFKSAEAQLQLFAEKSGYIYKTDSYILGKAAGLSGAGRDKKDDKIDAYAGILLNKQYGDYVEKGQLLATVYGGRDRVENAFNQMKSAFEITETQPPEIPIILDCINS